MRKTHSVMSLKKKINDWLVIRLTFLSDFPVSCHPLSRNSPNYHKAVDKVNGRDGGERGWSNKRPLKASPISVALQSSGLVYSASLSSSSSFSSIFYELTFFPVGANDSCLESRQDKLERKFRKTKRYNSLITRYLS